MTIGRSSYSWLMCPFDSSIVVFFVYLSPFLFSGATRCFGLVNFPVGYAEKQNQCYPFDQANYQPLWVPTWAQICGDTLSFHNPLVLDFYLSFRWHWQSSGFDHKSMILALNPWPILPQLYWFTKMELPPFFPLCPVNWWNYQPLHITLYSLFCFCGTLLGKCGGRSMAATRT